MKIAIICYSHFDATIGLGKYLHMLESSLKIEFIFLACQAKSINIEIVDLKGKSYNNGFINETELHKTLDQEIFDYLGTNANLKLFLFNSIKLIDLVNYKLLFQLRRYIASKKYDVIHFVGNNNFWVVFLNFILRKAIKIHTVHEPYPFFCKDRYIILRHKLNMKLLIKSSSHVIVPSNVSYNRLVSKFQIQKNKVSVIPFGPFEIYRAYSRERITKSNNTILYYGSISKYKGVEVLLQSMKEISKANPNLKLIIAGGGSIDDKVLNGNSNIKIINRYLSNREIAELNELATVVVCPYTSASQSGVVMTSLAFGNPIIATDVGAMREMIEDGVTGVIIEPNNAQLLSTTILSLFKDFEKINKLRQNAVAKYSNSEYSWTWIAEQTYDLYKKLSLPSNIG